jgi:hypothetical protein
VPNYFPQTNANGVITQNPYKTTQSFNSIVQEMPFARAFSTSQRGSGLNNFPTTPISNFAVGYTSVTDAEVATLQTFFDSMKGSLGSFIFLDPDGNLVNNSEDFTQASWTSQNSGVTVTTNGGLADPFGGTRASLLTATTSNSNYAPIVVAAGQLPNNFVLCGSLYAMAMAANQTLSLGFVDSGFGVLGNGVSSLPQNVWTRIYFAMQISSSSYIRLLIGGFGTWNSSAIRIFGPQCTPSMGPGSYSKSPENYGYHANCRFDTDNFTVTKIGPNQNSLALPVAEFFSGTNTITGETF